MNFFGKRAFLNNSYGFHKDKGFTLVEVLVAMAITSSLVLVATKILDIVRSTKRNSEVTVSLKKAHDLTKKDLSVHVRSLTLRDFNKRFFYFLGDDNETFDRMDPSLEITTQNLKDHWILRNWGGSKDVFSSLNYVKKAKSTSPTLKKYERYYSICVPIEGLSDFENTRVTAQVLAGVNYWPFIKANNSGFMSVRCCTLDNPNCNDEGSDPLSTNSDFVLRIVKNSLTYKFDSPNSTFENTTPKEVTRAIPAVGEKNNITGAGFFMTAQGSNPKKFIMFSVYYQSECLNKRIRIGGRQLSKPCTTRTKIEHSIKAQSFINSNEGRASDVGNVGW